MRNLVSFAALVVLVVVLAVPAMACQSNSDCDFGSKCEKRPGSLNGVCVGGANPGNSNDRKPVYSPTDRSGTYGNTCRFDGDCGPGFNCVKDRMSSYGTCL